MRRLILLLLLLAGAWAGWRWLQAHPQHNPFAPLQLDQPVGWATSGKLVALADDQPVCDRLLREAGVSFVREPAIGSGACRLADRTRLSRASAALRPTQPITTCPVAAGIILWQREIVQVAARRFLGERIAAYDHLGTVNCRRIGSSSRMSEHATGNAIDIAGFRTTSGRRISVLRGWQGKADERAFLRAVRDGACDIFGTTLSPDYNTAHRDHFHLDMANRATGAMCR